MTLAPESAPIRTVALWVPDWPVIAAMLVADLSPHLPATVMSSQRRVVAASAAARALGVTRGMRKRSAQSLCPSLVLLPDDEARDAKQFETVATAAEGVVSGLEVMRPGILLLSADGAARYHGGEPELVEALIEAVSGAGFECQVGIADGILAAVLAAREELVVPVGQSTSFLNPRPITDLLTVAVEPHLTTELTEAISLWARLGLNTLGDLAALPNESMAGRFGQLGVWAQRLSRGQDLRPPTHHRPAEDVAVTQKFDPPLFQVETAVVVGEALATEFVDLMLQQNLACGRIRITAGTPHGELSRAWRTDEGALGGMSAAGISKRLRWQLECWLNTSALRQPRETSGPSVPYDIGPSDIVPNESENFEQYPVFEDEPAPILSLEIAAEELAPASTYQMSLWGKTSGHDLRAARALGNVQGLLGLDQVLAVAIKGERTPWDREVRFTFGEPSPPLDGLADPWPSALPDPAPSIIYGEPLPARLLDNGSNPITVNQRIETLSAPPASLIFERANYPVVNWAGPWNVAGLWWEGEQLGFSYLQVVTEGGVAYLLENTELGWAVRGVYN